MTVLQMVDLSSNNTIYDLRKLWDAGHRILALKVSESTNYAWSRHNDYANLWHSFGGLVYHYHFLRPGSGPAQADHFWRNTRGSFKHGDKLVVDVEVGGIGAGTVNAFIDRVMTYVPRHRGLIYGTSYFLRDAGVKSHRGWGLWIAGYPNYAFLPPGFKTWHAHQYTQTGSVPGVVGNVDVSHLKPWALQPTLHYRDKNFAVYHLKSALRKAGYKGITMNNTYGMGLRRAVRKYKKDHKFNNHVGAVAGPRVWSSLKKYL